MFVKLRYKKRFDLLSPCIGPRTFKNVAGVKVADVQIDKETRNNYL